VQRFGFGYPQLAPGSLWLHAASADDLVAAVPVIEELRARHADIPIIVTTTTPAGAHAAAVLLPADVTHAYLPVDFREADERFLDAVRPRCTLVMATNPRLNLYRACRDRNIPLLVIDGHVTPGALRAPQWLREHDVTALNTVRAVLARSDRDRDRFVELGMDSGRIEVIGDIRFAPSAHVDPGDNPLPRGYVLAAATHADEEQRIASAWKELRTEKPLLVIAPLLPQRCAGILPQLDALQLNVAVRSRRDSVTAQTDVYLVDTLGELGRFIAHADFVFMGGSLVKGGGHDVLEPARAGKAVIFGPHMENFVDEASALREADAAVQVRDELELRTTLARMLASPKRQRAMGERGRELVAGQRDVARRYCDAIARYIVTESAPGA
jgi:3-deoxy-D-manno-octulosonic-acid transferase